MGRKRKSGESIRVDHRLQYDRHSTLPIAPVIEQISLNLKSTLAHVKVDFNGVLVKVTSLRLRTFALKSCFCSKCMLQATHFAIERTRGSQLPIYHLNLWAARPDGAEILFTHDHIIARALGGEDHLENTQTMCGPCNWEKSEAEGEEYRSRRELL